MGRGSRAQRRRAGWTLATVVAVSMATSASGLGAASLELAGQGASAAATATVGGAHLRVVSNPGDVLKIVARDVSSAGSGGAVPATPTALGPQGSGAAATVAGASPASSPASGDLPEASLRAYRAAAAALGVSDPTCGLDFALLAGIGRVESNHGRYAGATVGADGVSRPKIIGIPLDGRPGVARILDTDRGLLDGDVVFDRAVGPLQFIPGTWAGSGADGDGDGVADPHDIDDAALAAARYLCARDSRVDTPAGAAAALMRYNHSVPYGLRVLGLAEAYRHGVTVGGAGGAGPVGPPNSPAPGPVPPATDPASEPASAPGTVLAAPEAAPAQVPVATPGVDPAAVPPTDPATAPPADPATDPVTEPAPDPVTDPIADPVDPPAEPDLCPAEPVTVEPVTVEPVTTEPITPGPVAPELVATDPATAQPTAGEPAAAESPADDVDPCDPLAYAAGLVTAVNDVRAAAGVAPLVGSECVTAAALEQATSLLGSAELTPTPASDLLAACPPATQAEQLLSRAAGTPSGVVAQWLVSEELRGRLLDPELLEVGVGCVLDRGELLCSFVLVGR